MQKWVPKIYEKLGTYFSSTFPSSLPPSFPSSFPSSLPPIIDWTMYWNSYPDLRTYGRTNIQKFSTQSMSLLFHYWFIFHNRDRTKIKLITGTPSLTAQRISSFEKYLTKYRMGEVGPATPLLLYKFYVDYELWVPSSLQNTNKFEEIEEYAQVKRFIASKR